MHYARHVIADQVPALSSSTALVSITVGGNDVGFAGVMTACVVYGTSTCVSDVDTAEDTARTQLPGWLDNAYNAGRRASRLRLRRRALTVRGRARDLRRQRVLAELGRLGRDGAELPPHSHRPVQRLPADVQ